MLDHLTLFDLVGRKLDHTAERHNVLARNIANANTPGFVPHDVVEPDFRRLVAGRTVPPPALSATDARHLPGLAGPASSGRLQDAPGELKPSGNAVSLEIEAAKLRSNSGNHKLGTLLYGKYMSLLRTALGKQ